MTMHIVLFKREHLLACPAEVVSAAAATTTAAAELAHWQIQML